MSSFLKSIRQPLGDILRLDEVKRQAIVDALDKCREIIVSRPVLSASGKPRSIEWRGSTTISSHQRKNNSLLIVS
jgi:hypothetical protein